LERACLSLKGSIYDEPIDREIGTKKIKGLGLKRKETGLKVQRRIERPD